jgi:hypothetical protein
MVTKAGGELEPFSLEKLQGSLRRAGATEEAIAEVAGQVVAHFENGLSTRELYRLAFSLLKKRAGERPAAARYRLKQGIMNLGPSGFPFERYVGELLREQGYTVEVGQVLPGRCVDHEVDVVAENGAEYRLIECKYHNRRGDVTTVRDALYIRARFLDLREGREKAAVDGPARAFRGALWTSTRFTGDALSYSQCAGLDLVGWDHPTGGSLRDLIDRHGLYPITVLTALSEAEKRLLLERSIVLVRQIAANPGVLAEIGLHGHRLLRSQDEARRLAAPFAPGPGQ